MQVVSKKFRQVGILFVHSNNVDVGGADYCMFKIVRELITSRFRPVVVLRMKTDIAILYEQLGVKVIYLPLVRWQRGLEGFKIIRDLMMFPVSIVCLVFVVIKEKIRIVHSNDLLDFAGSIAARITGRYAIQHVRMIVIKNLFIRKCISKVLSLTNNTILCVSAAVRRWFFEGDSAGYDKSKVLFDWVDLPAVGHAQMGENIFEHLRLPRGTPLVGLVGRMEWWKGHHVFIHAAEKVRRSIPDAHFVIVGGKVYGRGRENYEQHLKQLALSLGIAEAVHFLGERKDILNILQQLMIAVHCSIEPDPFPGVVLEAMYAGKPVVASRGGGVIEQVEDGVSGLLFEPGNDRDLAEKLIYLLKNKQKCLEMGLEGQKLIEKKFNKEAILQQLMAIYEVGAPA
jgi:glycosyltransferase involved in cell wall biosynthesis